MKRILFSLTLIGSFACALAAFAQTNTPADAATAASATATNNEAPP